MKVEVPVFPETFAEIRAGRQGFLHVRDADPDAWHPGTVLVLHEIGDEGATEERTIATVYRVHGASPHGDVILGFVPPRASEREALILDAGECAIRAYLYGVEADRAWTPEVARRWEQEKAEFVRLAEAVLALAGE